MNVFHLVKVRFDRRRADINEAWLQKRANFFLGNTLPSLLGNTFEDWMLWINCDDITTQEMVRPPLLQGMPEMMDLRQQLVWTSGDGPPHCANFFPEQWARLIASDYVYITRIDSDDLYSCRALGLANACRPVSEGRAEASIFRSGYIYDVTDSPGRGRLGAFYNPSPPFHTLMIPTDRFLDPNAYRAIFEACGDHSKVAGALPIQVLPPGQFCVLVHGANFGTGWDYSRDPNGWVPKWWSIKGWHAQPVILDVDDYCDEYAADTIACMDQLRARYPDFRATLFGVPLKTEGDSLALVKERAGWLHLGVHGREHDPNQELKQLNPGDLERFLTLPIFADPGSAYVRGFRPPGWYLEPGHCRALAAKGYWIALHKDHYRQLGPLCRAGAYYVDEAGRNSAHFHTHNKCQNGIREALPGLLDRWPADQPFAFINDEVLIPPEDYARARGVEV
jgi:hypothetical protein